QRHRGSGGGRRPVRRAGDLRLRRRRGGVFRSCRTAGIAGDGRLKRLQLRENMAARLLHQTQQAELPPGTGEWLLAVIGAVAAQPPACPPQRLPLLERRAALERKLLSSGLAYGTGAQDPAVELDPAAGAGVRA